MSIEVKAKARGFYGALREVGDVFVIAKEEDFSDIWMEKTASKEKEKPASKGDKS